MTTKEYIEFANALKNNYTIDFDKLPEFCDMAISAVSVKGESISRQAVINAIANTIVNGESLGYGLAEEIVSEIPSTENKGEWIMPIQDDGMSDPYYYQVCCSKCGFDIDPQTWYEELHQFNADNYCPNCGADMRRSE